MKHILIYPGDAIQTGNIAARILKELAIPCTLLDDSALQQQVGWLFQLEGYEEQPKKEPLHFAQDLMLLKDIRDEEVVQFNKRCRKANIHMPRKAMLTKHNQTWLLKDLMLEILEEHRYFTAFDELKELLASSSELIIEEYTPASWKTYEQAFYKGYEAYSKQAEPKLLYETLQQLKAARQALTKK